MCKVCSSHINNRNRNELHHFRTFCPWQRMRIRKSYRWPVMSCTDDPVTKRQHGVCGGKKIHHNPKCCSSKNFLWGWFLSPIQAFHFWLWSSSESLCLMKTYQHPLFPVRSLRNVVIPITVDDLPNSSVWWVITMIRHVTVYKFILTHRNIMSSTV